MIAEILKNKNLNTILLNLQKRLIMRERTLLAMKNILRNRIGDPGLFEIISEMEGKGIKGGEIFLD